MKSVTFHVLYDGEALKNHQMDVKELAPAILALSDLLEEANNILNKGQAKISLNVKASFKEGSFGIEFHTFFSILKQAQSLFGDISIADARDILEIIGLISNGVGVGGGGLIGFIKWLKNRKITKVEETKNPNVLKITVSSTTIENGTVETGTIETGNTEVAKNIIDLFRDTTIRKDMEKVLKPLEKEGIDTFAAVNYDTKKDKFVIYEKINKEEISYFQVPIGEEELLQEKIEEMNLTVISLSFEEKYKWRFAYGESGFLADMQDIDFFSKIKSREVNFSKGDIIFAQVKKREYLQDNKMKVDYTIIKVLNHRKSIVQTTIPLVE